MAKVYRDINIQVGLGLSPSQFVGPVLDVMTENSIARLLITFPASYADYRKIMDIAFTTASEVYTVESYELSYNDNLGVYFFLLERRFTYNQRAYIQFRARYPDNQEAVDPAILSFKFKRALKEEDLQQIDANPQDSFTVTLQEMVTEHAVVNASTAHTGHVKVDNDTITIDQEGVIRSTGGGSTSVEDQLVALFPAGDDTRICSTPAVYDAEGYVHGLIKLYGVSEFNGNLYYFTNKKTGTKKMRIYARDISPVSEEFPTSHMSWEGNGTAEIAYYESTGKEAIAMKFDVSDVPGTIISASLILKSSIQSSDAGEYVPITTFVNELGDSWSESTVTWADTSTMILGTLASFTMNCVGDKVSSDISNIVNTWISDPSSNNGMIVEAAIGDINNVFYNIYGSSSGMFSDSAPYILVEYTSTDTTVEQWEIIPVYRYTIYGYGFPSISVDSNGTVHVALMDSYVSGPCILHLSIINDEVRIKKIERLYDDESYDPKIVCDQDDKLYVSYMSSSVDPGNYTLRIDSRTNNVWTNEYEMTLHASSYSYYPQYSKMFVGGDMINIGNDIRMGVITHEEITGSPNKLKFIAKMVSKTDGTWSNEDMYVYPDEAVEIASVYHNVGRGYPTGSYNAVDRPDPFTCSLDVNDTNILIAIPTLSKNGRYRPDVLLCNKSIDGAYSFEEQNIFDVDKNVVPFSFPVYGETAGQTIVYPDSVKFGPNGEIIMIYRLVYNEAYNAHIRYMIKDETGWVSKGFLETSRSIGTETHPIFNKSYVISNSTEVRLIFDAGSGDPPTGGSAFPTIAVKSRQVTL